MHLIINGSLRKARPLKTGQSTSYGSGIGVDDGGYEKGIVKSYTILTIGQYSGTVDIVLNGKTDAHSNNCVLDNNTGLMWSRYVSASVGPTSDGKLPWTTNASGEGIFPYAAAANAAALAGFTDWRIPNEIELASLRDMEAPNALPDASAFPSFPQAYCWTSTTRPSATSNAQTVGFLIGDVGPATKTSASYYCPPLVRG